MKPSTYRIAVVLCMLLLAPATAFGQRPERPNTDPVTTNSPGTGRRGQNCYFCNTGQVNKGWTTTTRTYILAEYNDVCDATCARCVCTEYPGDCPGPRDGGKDDHSMTVSGKAIMEKASELIGEIGGTDKTGGKIGWSESSSGSITAETTITLGKKNTHAHKGEKLVFYGYVALTVTSTTGQFTFTYSGWDIYDSSATWIESATLTVKNGYDVIPCKCPDKRLGKIETPRTVTGGTAVAMISTSPDVTVTVHNSFPAGVAHIVTLDTKEEQDLEPRKSTVVKGKEGVIIGAALLGTAVALLPGGGGHKALPPKGSPPQIQDVTIGQTQVKELPVYGGGQTPVVTINGAMPPESEVRLITQAKGEPPVAITPRPIATVTTPDGQIVQQVVKFDELPAPGATEQCAIAVVDKNGEMLTRQKIPLTNAAMMPSVTPRTGPPGSSAMLTIDVRTYLKTLRMERTQFDPKNYDLAIDYSLAGGTTGPGRVPIDPSGIVKVPIRRGNLGEFPLLLYLIEKSTVGSVRPRLDATVIVLNGPAGARVARIRPPLNDHSARRDKPCCGGKG